MTGSITITPAYGTYSGTAITFNNSDISIKKSANLMELPMPLSDSSDTDVFDFMGCTKKITLNGVFDAANNGSSAIIGFTGSVDSLIQGQQTYSTLKSINIAGSLIVKADNFNYDYLRGNPNSIRYNLTLIQTTTTS